MKEHWPILMGRGLIDTHTHTHTYTRARTHARTHTHTHAHTHTHTHARKKRVGHCHICFDYVLFGMAATDRLHHMDTYASIKHNITIHIHAHTHTVRVSVCVTFWERLQWGYHWSVAYAGFVQGGGFNHAGPEKADGGGGGLRHIFFFCASFTLLGRGTVRLPDRPPG